MHEFLNIPILPILVTMAGYWIGTLCQKKWKSPILNPILIGMIMVVIFLLSTGMDTAVYKAGTDKISWLMTPATISLAIPLYEQFQILRKDLKAIAIGVACGAITCVVVIMVAGIAIKMDRTILISIMPKSVTAAIGMALSDLFGGIGAVSTAAIAITGIGVNMFGVSMCKRFCITDPIAQGVAFGTAGHVIGTAKASEVSPLVGAVSSLSLVVAGLLTSLLFPALVTFL
jgi:putative effector of murein hydrolase